MKAQVILAAIVTTVGLSVAAAAQTNVLVNGDFESNPPPGFGNHSGYSISPWVLGPGQSSNVVKVDGPGGFNYGSNGPESDASAPGAGIPQHYLDIVDGKNYFYQSFTPQCSGEVIFGGYFSTRGNAGGTADVKIVEGVGPSGNVVGQTNTVSLPAGNSRTDPWTLASFTVHVNAMTTYSFIVNMTNNLNFDNGFVRYELACTPPDPCCPPWSSAQLEDMLFYQGSGGISAPYTLRFIPSTGFTNQIQAYIDYLGLVNPLINRITIAFAVNQAGMDNAPAGGGQQLGNIYGIGWDVNGGGIPVGATNFFTLGTEPMLINRWYRVNTSIFLNDRLTFFPASCANNHIDVRIQVLRASSRFADPVLQIRMPDGRILEKPVSSRN